MLRFVTGRNYRYSALQVDSREKSQYCTLAFLLETLVVLALMTTSFIAGRLSFRTDLHTILSRTIAFFVGSFRQRDDMAKLPSLLLVSAYSRNFEYAPIFGSAPSNASNMAWSHLFPEQGGFFKHPTLAPQRSAFSVFHQLHCLDGIRQGYYALHGAATSNHQINETGMPMMSSPRHIAHCIDLIRQSLMCQPDTTIEVKNESVGGVTGFGTRHLCRDWEGLMAWATEWQAFDQKEREKSERNP